MSDVDDYLAKVRHGIMREYVDMARRLMGLPNMTDDEWVEWVEWLAPENVEARRLVTQKRASDMEADRRANPEKYTCSHCGRDYEE